MTGFLARLFGKARAPEPEPVLYKDYHIHPEPVREAGGWRTGGRISRTENGTTREHRFIRADIHASREAADSFSITKARQIIDQSGPSMFDDSAPA